jgi:dTMP kinase
VTAKARFISLEGGEGVGKSTQVRALAAALRERGLSVLETREPGGSEGAESIRRLLLEERDWPIEAEALLFAAARADHSEKTIRPALERGDWVVSDRFIHSSLAYQGGAGGLGVERVRDLHRFATGDFYPDRTLILSLPEGKERALARDGHSGDRIGGRGRDFHHKVDLAFRMIAAEEPERVRLVDASGPEGEVTQRLIGAISDLLQ